MVNLNSFGHGSDLEITKRCAAAMGYTGTSEHWGDLPLFVPGIGLYEPLRDDAQAMALVKKFGVALYIGDEDWYADLPDVAHRVKNRDLNRAICECVAALPLVASIERAE